MGVGGVEGLKTKREKTKEGEIPRCLIQAAVQEKEQIFAGIIWTSYAFFMRCWEVF